MNSASRREEILGFLRKNLEPVKGVDLAEEFSVSRQVIVQDIAVLRAAGQDIFATPQGYMMPQKDMGWGIRRTIVTVHHNMEAIGEELRIIVDNGGEIIDVVVEHPVYGEIRGNLMISSRHDVDNFVEKISLEKAEPLCSLTEGVHLHTIEVPDESTFERIVSELDCRGYLLREG